METVTIGRLRSSLDGGAATIQARMTTGGQRFDLFMRATRGPLATGAEPFVHVGLFAAMRLGVPLHIEGALPVDFLRRLDDIQDILSAWHPTLRKAHIDVEQIEDGVSAPAGAGVGSFFSGGVDSSYTALKHGAELTDLTLVRGFDMPLSDQPLWDVVAPRLGTPLPTWAHA